MKGYFTIIACFFYGVNFAQRDTVAINADWQFTTDKKNEGLATKWFERKLSGTVSVNLPHTWNIEKENEMHYGWGWYQKKINIPARWKHKNVVLQFGAINHTSYIYINGEKVVENIGDGFNKFFINLNGKVNYGKDNIITVACNNDYGKNKVPYSNSFDWPNDGGIIRTVSLIVSDKPAVTYLHATPTLNIANNSGSVNIKLGFDEAANSNLQFAISITEENQLTNNIVYSATKKAVWKNKEAIIDINLPRVNPWHFDFPNLYRIVVTTINGKKETDIISANIGFRDIKFTEGKTYLNGERIKLMGVEWTAGSNPNYGFAEPVSEIIRHGELMKEVNCIFSRVHFQQDDVFYDFCDRNGILVQEEIPLWGGETPANDTIQSIAFRQLDAMIRNHYNHPSIITWGVGNELRGRDADMKKFIQHLIAKAKQFDSTRFVSYVSNTLTSGYFSGKPFEPDAGSLGDYVMMNEYGGSWWDLPVAQIGTYMDSIHLSYSNKPFFISEFGLCEPNFKGGDERRIEDLLYHMGIYESKSYVEGAIYFDLTDYRTHYPGTSEKSKFRRRIHGIYDMYGKPKPSMKVLRELSSPVEVQTVHQWKKGKLTLAIFGSLGLPQHIIRGYKVYITDSTGDYKNSKGYELPVIQPGEKKYIEVDDLYNGKGVITVVRPNGFVVSQKSFY
ncbi:MAG: glycoside hydrolase family 2 TIM barrel-domain containing protein [Chitinophagaceae bacterium]